MNTLETIMGRKSNRAFNGEAVERGVLEQIAKAGVAAPAGMGKAIYVTVVTNPDAVAAINTATKQVMMNSGVEALVKMGSDPDRVPLYNAPVAVLVSAQTVEDPQGASNNLSNCAAAAENVVLAATDLGLASVYVTSPTLAFHVPGMKEKCGIADDQTVHAIVALGYSDDKAPAVKHINEANIKFVE